MIIYPHTPKKKNRKPTAAQRQLAADWESMMKRYEPKTPSKKVSVSTVHSKVSPVVTGVYVRETKNYKSLSSSGGVATKREPLKYTGTKMIGIGTLHKSNAVPIFSDDEAIEISRMRRG